MTEIERADIERRLSQVRSQVAAAEAKPEQVHALTLPLLRQQEAELQATLD